MKAQDDCLKYPELYRDRLECSLAFGDIPTEVVELPDRPAGSYRTILISLAICAGVGLAHIVW